MECAYVERRRVFVVETLPEDLANYPTPHTPFSSQAQTSLITSTATATANVTEGESFSPTPSSSASQRSCRCIIDLSSTDSLRRDFYNWLQGIEPSPSDRPCIFDDIQVHQQSPSGSSTNLSPTIIPTKQQQRTRRKRSTDSDQSNGTTISDQPEKKKGPKRGGSGRGTNLYGRAYCPGRPLSMDERYQIIQLFHAGMKVNAISKQLCISHGCVSKIITRFRETGLLIPSSHAECRRRKRLQMEAAALAAQQATLHQ